MGIGKLDWVGGGISLFTEGSMDYSKVNLPNSVNTFGTLLANNSQIKIKILICVIYRPQARILTSLPMKLTYLGTV
jgi:hypothetical protein